MSPSLMLQNACARMQDASWSCLSLFPYRVGMRLVSEDEIDSVGGWHCWCLGDSEKLRPWVIPPAVVDGQAARKEPLEFSHGHYFPYVVIMKCLLSIE